MLYIELPNFILGKTAFFKGFNMGIARVQNLDEADCISHSTNTFGKGMHLIILPPAMGK